jgi:hypothetical protein
VSATICGHDRETLIWALGGEFDPLPSCGCESTLCQAQVATYDPAKLAELIAAELQRCDVHAWVVKHEYRPICWGVRGDEYGGFWEMPQARAILVALLPLPDGAREQAERAIRGET